MSFFAEPYTRSKSKTKVELGLSNYVIKSDLKNEASVETLDFDKTIDLGRLNS